MKFRENAHNWPHGFHWTCECFWPFISLGVGRVDTKTTQRSVSNRRTWPKSCQNCLNGKGKCRVSKDSEVVEFWKTQDQPSLKSINDKKYHRSFLSYLNAMLTQNGLVWLFKTENSVPRIGLKTRSSRFRLNRVWEHVEDWKNQDHLGRVSTDHKKYKNICLLSLKYFLSRIVL